MNFFQKILFNRKEKKRLKKEAREAALKKAKARSASIERLIVEYRRIEKKESKLSRKNRQMVIQTVHSLIRSGEIEAQHPEALPHIEA